MEYRLRPLGFMEFFAKQQSKQHETLGSQSIFHELNIYISHIYLFIYYYYIIVLS